MIKYIKDEMLTFYISISYYTRINLPFIKIKDFTGLSKAIKYLPLVGILLGVINLFVYILSYSIFNDKLISSLFMLIGYVYITRAFHEDGLTDVFDAFGGGYNKDKILLILKDSRIGIFGATALIFSILLRIIFYSKITYSFYSAIILAPFFSRFYPLLSVKFYNYVYSKESESKTIIDKNSITYLLLIIYFLMLFGALFYIKNYLIFVPLLNLIIWYWIMIYFNKKINGYRGDCLGAIQQISEIIFLITYYAVTK
ncbi:MAG TPA: adenosylcobinamide-GDP ribazoletransferase [Ignavibacteriales bacterium]|nr:adenosylcobinamide-GDP ribazoletransferase [Ignavibacteriales bacterium]HPD67786.1 adenosylcobinamide-GDP ribazoletransferase [Ignavibacteriales bacterium]HPP33170.1 adenosylcobinamide-GDP ribazoletransferase [Ignavibacteriales bacterium]HRR17846.1 adenosylcobinamide-GDP ribazoletransferase [Ignavibacteriales bacterium]HRT99336.1 adenosylcobinamide-GDP ribazoletransferase [Ignavibacteriales bacterium]